MFNMTLLYMNRNIPLQAKILFGYMMLMARLKAELLTAKRF